MRCFKLFLATIMLLVGNVTVLGNPESSLYQTQVNITDRSNQALQKALPEALEQVLVKVTDDPAIMSEEKVREHLVDVQKYVERYEYLPEIGEDGQEKLVLSVKFSSSSINQLLKKNIPPEPVVNSDPISLHIYGINGLNDFSEVVNYVRALPSVTSVEASTVDANDVILTVKINGGVEKLTQGIEEAKDHRLKSRMAESLSSGEKDEMLTYHWMS